MLLDGLQTGTYGLDPNLYTLETLQCGTRFSAAPSLHPQPFPSRLNNMIPKSSPDPAVPVEWCRNTLVQ